MASATRHDVREPLRRMPADAQLLKRRFGAPLGDEANRLIASAIEATNRMQAMIVGLLSCSRIDERPLDPLPDEMDAAFDVAAHALDSAAQEAGALITRDPLPACPRRR
ncbi:MAG: hypothetical protein GEU90_13395 [Gemmatimonas sp.]|nr:hypothetical protein [Gemmatimonas sp.]